MPSKSPAQKRLMAAASHSPAFAKKAGVPQGVAEEFNEADQAHENEAAEMPAMPARPPSKAELAKQMAMARALRGKK